MSADVALTRPEALALARHEIVVKAGLSTFRDVGTALAAIRDERLYRAEHATFEDYCQQRWNLARAHAYRMIDAAVAVAGVAAVSPMGDKITSERQARELTGLPADVAAQVVEVAAADGPVTAAALRVAREQVAPRPARVDVSTGEILDDRETAEALAPFDHDREWVREHFPALDVPHAPDADVARVAAMVLTHPEADQARRAEAGGKWLAAQVRRAGQPAPALPDTTGARVFTAIGELSVQLARHSAATRAAFDEGSGMARANWAGMVTSLLSQVTELHSHVTAPLNLRSVQ